MSYTRRNLPHYHPPGGVFFVTWRLFGNSAKFIKPQDPGRAFVAEDRILGRADTGPIWLRDARVAGAVVEVLKQGQSEKKYYDLAAYDVMPNHVHAMIEPFRELRLITQWIKGTSARAANLILGRVGPFWLTESYDRYIRSDRELVKIVRYIENNPVKAGLAGEPEGYPWSSAGQAEACFTAAKRIVCG